MTVTLLAIGDIYGGGKVAYILQPGEYNGVCGYDANVQHGLIAATADHSTNIQWYNGYVETGATATAIGFGQANTAVIVAKQGAGSYAAQVCNDLTVGVYNDWFLPSKDELAAMRTNLASTPEDRSLYGFADTYYWSSSEYLAHNAWFQGFYDGIQNYFSKYSTYRVRAVRAF